MSAYVTFEPIAGRPKIISRLGVYGVVKQNAHILLVKQRGGPHDGKWDLPGGGIEAGESIEEALRREFLEEVGSVFDQMQLLDNLTVKTDTVDDDGTPYVFHQIGLIYTINEVVAQPKCDPELEYSWFSDEQLRSVPLAPFVIQLFEAMPVL